MIKGYLDQLNRSEFFLVMTGGMATLAGGVLAAYIDFLGGNDPVQRLLFAKHLLSASVMAAPGAVVISKIIFPQTEEIPVEIKIPRYKTGSNIRDARTLGRNFSFVPLCNNYWNDAWITLRSVNNLTK